MNHRTLALLGLLAVASAPVARPRAEEGDAPAKPAGPGASVDGEKEKGGVPGAWKKGTRAVDDAAHKGADAVVSGVKKGAKAVDAAAHKGADKITGDEKK